MNPDVADHSSRKYSTYRFNILPTCPPYSSAACASLRSHSQILCADDFLFSFLFPLKICQSFRNLIRRDLFAWSRRISDPLIFLPADKERQPSQNNLRSLDLPCMPVSSSAHSTEGVVRHTFLPLNIWLPPASSCIFTCVPSVVMSPANMGM